MHTKCFLVLALAFFGASGAPLASTATVGGTVGPTVSETVITPFHRTDSVSTPCGRSVVRTAAVPVVPYGPGFLGTVYPGVVGNGFAGNGVGVAAGGFLGNGGIGCRGVVGVYPGVAGVGVLGGVYPQANLIV